MKIATYDYLCFLDADDWWAPNFLEEMKMLIEKYPDAGIYGSSYFKVKNGKNIPAKIGVSEGFMDGYFDYFEAYSKSMWMPLWTGAVAVSKNSYHNVGGFKSSLKLGEDFDLWVRIALKYSACLLNQPLSFYNQDVEIENRAVVIDKIYEPQSHFIFNLDYLQKEEADNANLKQVLDNLRVHTLARYYLQNKYIIDFEQEIRKVDMLKQPKPVVRFYKTPRSILLIRQNILRKLSQVKKFIQNQNDKKNNS